MMHPEGVRLRAVGQTEKGKSAWYHLHTESKKQKSWYHRNRMPVTGGRRNEKGRSKL